MNQTDPDLRDRIADALLTTRRADYADLGVKANHRQHRFDARCALCTYDVDALADAVLAVLPAPTDQTAATEAPLSPDYEHPECGFHWHGRDGMDIPMRDGQPVCPRCELRKVERRLAHFERRCTELREESLRRGKNVLDHSEKTRALEREIDGVRRQLGAEILRANRAEAELRRLAGEAHRCGNCEGIDPTSCLANPAREAQQPETEARGPWGTRPRCTCSHAEDEHSVYGCLDDCACEWMPKRKPMDPEAESRG